jgi:DnaK suppressor protein
MEDRIMTRKKPSTRRKTRLKALEHELLALEAHLKREMGRQLGHVGTVASDHPVELIDMASDGQMDNIAAATAQADAETLELIEHALGNLHDGTYGKCEDCGCRIPAARLRARPFAVLCVGCKQCAEQDGRFRTGGRSVGFAGDLPESQSGSAEASFNDVMRSLDEFELSKLF